MEAQAEGLCPFAWLLALLRGPATLSLTSAFLSRLSGFFGDKNRSQRRIIIISWFSTSKPVNGMPDNLAGQLVTPQPERVVAELAHNVVHMIDFG